ncbi:MAG: winged helix-turn-helix domain-containing protein [Myxococcota bacterium]
MVERVNFGPFLLNLTDRCLLRDGVELEVQPLVVELLAFAIQHPGRLLTREQVSEVLWPGVVVSEQSLSQVVYKVRQALGEHRGWWRTIPRRGYRFEAPLAEVPLESPQLPLSQPSTNLPARRDRFIGREAELESVCQVIEEGRRLITLTGFGGVGKSRLAMECLREQPAARWPGGRWFCMLADVRDAESLCTAIARTLSVPLMGDPIEQLGQVFAGRGAALVVLDCFEQLASFAAETVGRWLDQAPEVVFVLTSRTSSKLLGETRIPIAPLPIDDATALLCERARLVDVDTEEVREIVEQFDRLPLAIELIAPQVINLTFNGLLRRLRRGWRSPPGRHPERAARHQTLWETLRWSWELLHPDEQRALAQCSVFEDGFTFEAAEAILDLESERSVDDVLVSLIEHSLMFIVEGQWTGEPRIHMFSTTREFATRQLTVPGPVEQRHGVFYAEYEEQDAARIAPRTRVEELRNLIVAHQRALKRGDTKIAVDCALAAVWVYKRNGPFGEGAALLKAALAEPDISPEGRCRLHFVLSELYNYVGDRLTASEHLDAAGTLLDRQTSLPPELLLQWDLYTGMMNYKKRDFKSSVDALKRVISQASDLDARYEMNNALLLLGHIAHQSGELDKAVEIYRRVSCKTTLKHIPSIWANAMCSLGLVYNEQFNPRAHHVLQKSLELYRRIGDRNGYVYVLYALIVLHQAQGRIATARALVEEALAECRQIGAQDSKATHLALLASLARIDGDYEQGRAALRESIAISTQLDIPYRCMRCWIQFGLLEASAKNFAAAHEYFSLALEYTSSVEQSETYVWDVYVFRSTTFLRQGIWSKAESDLRFCAEHVYNLPDLKSLWNNTMGLLYAHRGEHHKASQCFQESKAIIPVGEPMLQTRAFLDHTEAAVLANDLETAQKQWAQAQALISKFEMKPQAGFVTRLNALSEQIRSLKS